MAFCEFRATIDAEKAVFHRIISGACKAVFGPGALSMSEADALCRGIAALPIRESGRPHHTYRTGKGVTSDEGIEREADRIASRSAEGGIMINASRMYLITNAHTVPVEQRHTLHAQLKVRTFCFGAFRTPEAIVIALVATEQTITHLQEQFRVLEFELGMMEQDYLAELYQPDEIIPLKKER